LRKEVIETGKTLEEAINAACEKLGISRYDSELEIEVIDRPKKSFLGFKNIPAKVKVSVEVPGEEPKPQPKAHPQAQPQPQAQPKPQPKPQPQQARPQPQPQPKPQQPAHPPKPHHSPIKERVKSAPVSEAEQSEKEKLAKEYIRDILAACGLTAEYKVSREENGAFIDIEGEGLGLIIGRRGETLDALQYLAGLVANRGEGDYLRLTVDCGEYRVKRKDTLEALAKRLAQQVLKTNVSKTLEPMNPFERRIIHATVSEIEGVSSSSVGEEPGRRVVITTPTAKPGRPSRESDDKFRSRPPRRESSERPPRRENGPRPPRAENAAPNTAQNPAPSFERSERREDRRDERRGGGRGRDGRPPRRQSPPIPQGPPKQTPEAEAMSSVKFGKIDLE
jgi:spoIIIJ-associated protein